MNFVYSLGNPVILTVAIACFITSLTFNIKKKDKLADGILVVFWMIVLIQMLVMVTQLAQDMSQSYGYPNVALMLSMIGVCFYSFLLMLIRIIIINFINFETIKLKSSVTNILTYLVVVLMSGSILFWMTKKPEKEEYPNQPSEVVRQQEN